MTMTTIAEPLTFVRHPDPVVIDADEPAAISTDPRSTTRPSRIGDVLFRSAATAPIWLVVRVWLGYEWLVAGLDKLHAPSAASWFGDAPALVGFVHGADASWANRAKAFGHPAVHYAWFLNFLHFIADHAWLFGPIVVFSELLIGLGLITGLLTRWAAIGGVALNVMYIMGGSAGVNGVFMLLSILLICAWRVSGNIGGDGVVRKLRVGALH
jgi:thiosulfate dehydrogenase [quinone] large subunit